MFALIIILALSTAGLLAALLVPGLSDWLLLAGPCTLASLFLLLRQLLRGDGAPGAWRRGGVILDGSNIMHWKGQGPDLGPVQEAVRLLRDRGQVPLVVFDANAGYKLCGRYQGSGALAKRLGMRPGQVRVVPKGTPADEVILQLARQRGARVVTNDRFRDWVDRHPEVAEEGYLLRGGYRAGRLWLDPRGPAGAEGGRLRA
ncbi:NYN domain-containing protein [Pseudooceanicola sp. 200-1SW]|uniref:NYN domain-containing protein n=1 Tax=Pseudooceanicola sp. 200-1SW TaxID=3425949 RepID=UPI003D7F3290